MDHCLTMAAYSAFVVLRRYLVRNPGLGVSTAIGILRQTSSDNTGLDYAGGAAIHQFLQADVSCFDHRKAIQTTVFEIVKFTQPWWLRLVPYGRAKVKAVLNQDQIQCFREAGLFDAVPDASVLTWWDEIGAAARSTVDVERMLRARQAERLSLEYERVRLQRLRISLEPEWVSLEDNTLGYDIRSYELSGGEIVCRLIEVKSTTSGAIFITKNEWLNASSAERNYYFHIWKFPEKCFVEYSVAAMRPNMPIDKGSGMWQDVMVSLDIFP